MKTTYIHFWRLWLFTIDGIYSDSLQQNGISSLMSLASWDGIPAFITRLWKTDGWIRQWLIGCHVPSKVPGSILVPLTSPPSSQYTGGKPLASSFSSLEKPDSWDPPVSPTDWGVSGLEDMTSSRAMCAAVRAGLGGLVEVGDEGGLWLTASHDTSSTIDPGSSERKTADSG